MSALIVLTVVAAIAAAGAWAADRADLPWLGGHLSWTGVTDD